MKDAHRYIALTFKFYPEDRQFTGMCVELGVATCGDTIDEAMKNLDDAVRVYIEALDDAGERERYFKERGIRVERLENLQRAKPIRAGFDEIVTRHRHMVPA